jgi:hypothetical protein
MRISIRMKRAMTARHWLVLGCICAAALGGSACAGSDKDTAEEQPAAPAAATVSDSSTATAPADAPATASPADPAAEEVATGFLEAYAAFDVNQAMTYLADDADFSGLVNSVGPFVSEATVDDLRLHVALLEAESYKQLLHPCENLANSTSGTDLRCRFDYHILRSDEIGLGPYSGSYFDFTVRDGEIVHVSEMMAINEFSPQMWEPFRAWVATTYPEDAKVMYAGGGAAFTEESIALWKQRSQEYAKEVAQKG